MRYGTLRDVLMASAMAPALREAFPRAHLTWAVDPHAAPLVHANPYVDDVLPLDRLPEWDAMLHAGHLRAWYRDLRALARDWRARQFDVVLDAQGSWMSGLLSRLSGAPRRIGPLPAERYHRFFMTDSIPLPAHPTQVSQGCLALLTSLGVPLVPRRPVLDIPEGERDAAREYLASQGLPTGGYAACCISSSHAQRNWTWPHWGKLVDQLYERDGIRTVFIGGPERRVDCLRILETSASKPVSTCGHTPLLQSAAIVQDATLVIGVDTGLTYAGLPTGTPTVVLYGASDPGWLTEEPATAICFHPLPCSPCLRPTCANYDCMNALSEDEVYQTVTRLMARERVMA